MRRLVAFPTETVRTGSQCTDGQAVARVFVAKGRPQDNPLIVHIACLDDLQAVVAGVPDDALALRALSGRALSLSFSCARRCCPRSSPPEAIQLRFECRPSCAMALIRAAGLPIAAPSANTSGRPSPTRADHVWADLAGRIEMIVDGGPAGIGVESTVLDITSSPPLVLRPGGVPVEAIRNIVPGVCVLPQYGTGSAPEEGEQKGPARSPGLRHKHYAPRAPLWLFMGEWDDQVQAIACRARAEAEAGRVVGLLISTETAMTASKASLPDTAVIAQTGSRGRMASVASGLFDAMRRLDGEGVDVMLAESYDAGGVGLAVMNRLVRSAGGRLVYLGESGRK